MCSRELDPGPQVQLTVHGTEILKTTRGLTGQLQERIPLSEGMAVQSRRGRNGLWLAGAVFSITLGMTCALVLVMPENPNKGLLSAAAWLLAAGAFLAAYKLSDTFEFTVLGANQTGVRFKPGLLEGGRVSFDRLVEASEIVMERIRDAHWQAQPAATVPHVAPQSDVSIGTAEVPPAPVSREPVRAESPARQMAYAGAGGGGHAPPRTKGTGTVEYGSDPGLDSADDWEGRPEPGTANSVFLQQALARPLRPPADMDDLDDDDYDGLDDPAPRANGGAQHLGTVSWEDHADKAQDEIKAQALLTELKESHPKRGEAKLRLRELIRRFPQTEAAGKARHLLERLESAR